MAVVRQPRKGADVGSCDAAREAATGGRAVIRSIAHTLLYLAMTILGALWLWE